MKYQRLEEALASLRGLEENQVKALRARLRVLRYMGVPDVPKVGSGKRFEYSYQHFWESHVALLLTDFGFPPQRIVRIMRDIREELDFNKLRSATDDLWEMILFFKVPDDSQGEFEDDAITAVIIQTHSDCSEHVKRQEADGAYVYGMLNVSIVTRQCDLIWTKE